MNAISLGFGRKIRPGNIHTTTAINSKELAERAPAPTPAQEQARLVIDKTERALREVIEQIEDPEAKREAIRARAGLYQAGVKEYRAERREAERQRSRERDDFDLER